MSAIKAQPIASDSVSGGVSRPSALPAAEPLLELPALLLALPLALSLSVNPDPDILLGLLLLLAPRGCLLDRLPLPPEALPLTLEGCAWLPTWCTED